MTQFVDSTQTLRWLRVGELVIKWQSAQRPLNEKRAKEIADNFDPDMFGTLTVAELPDAAGRYHVVDGWTRTSAVRILYGDMEKVPCVVVPAEDAARAADIFRNINGGRAKPSAMIMYDVSVAAKAPTEVAVHKIVTELGLRIDLRNLPGSIAAVGAVLSLYKAHGGNSLRLTLQTIKDTWGVEVAAFDANIIKGFGMFLSRFANQLDLDSLKKKLAKKFTPGRLVGSAKATREAFGGSMAKGVTQVLIEVYNSQRHQGRLGEPDDRPQRAPEPVAIAPVKRGQTKSALNGKHAPAHAAR